MHSSSVAPPSLHWYSGALLSTPTLDVSIQDPALLFGATVFTTLRVQQQSLEAPLTGWVEHRDRLKLSVDALGWHQPDWTRVYEGAQALLPFFPVLRITLFPDGREWIVGRSLPERLSQWQTHGICTWLDATSQFQRSLPTHKTGNYLAPWLARQTAQQFGAEEAILTNSQGQWLETSTGNLWGWRKGRWWTPPLTAGILPGIMRSQLISWLKCQNENVEEQPWDESLVSGFEVMAYSNSVVQIVPIHTVLRSADTLIFNPNHNGFQLLNSLFEASEPQNPEIG